MAYKYDQSDIESISELIDRSHMFTMHMSHLWRGLADGTRIDFDRPPGRQGMVTVSKGRRSVGLSRYDPESLTEAVAKVRAMHRAEPWHVRLGWFLRSPTRS
jgi:hypothetical protein